MQRISIRTIVLSAFVVVGMLFTAMMSSCEKPLAGTDDEGGETVEGKVRLRVNAITGTVISFSETKAAARKTSAVANACSRLSFAIYKDGERVVSENQKADDKDFGSLDVTLEKGKYRIVAIGHSGTASATTTDATKIKFPNNKVTDTFWASTEVNLTDGTTVELELRRVVAMFRLIVEDKIPANVATMRFYYTGGSSTLDGTTGYGCVNSKQTEDRSVDSDMRSGGAVFEVYTFPHAEKGELNMTVTALDSEGNTVKQQTFPEVGVVLNRITQYTGEFFSESPDDGRSKITVTINDEWDGVDKNTY